MSVTPSREHGRRAWRAFQGAGLGFYQVSGLVRRLGRRPVQAALVLARTQAGCPRLLAVPLARAYLDRAQAWDRGGR